MDKYLCRKDVYDVLEKAMRDKSHLTQKKITDKNGHQRTVWVRPGEEPVQQKTKKTEVPGDKTTAKFKTPLEVIDYVVENGGDISNIKSQKLLKEAKDLSLRVSTLGEKDPEAYQKKLSQFRADCSKRIEELKNGKTSSKPKYEVGSSVSLDGAKGDFKIRSIDKDGTYHVVSADGKKGYKVSENHIKGNAEQKAEPSQEDKKEVAFEKKNNASKSEENERKNDAENNVNDAIKITDSEKKAIMKTLEDPDLQSAIEKYGNKDPSTIGNMILNNLNSSGNKELFNKIRNQEWDYKNANNKHGNTFNSDYAKEAMHQIYKEYQKQKLVDQMKNTDWDSLLS